MTTDAARDKPVASTEPSDGQTERRRSEISFPYDDLQKARSLAEVIAGRWGGHRRISSNEVAAAAGHENAKGGAFQVKVSTARIFGLVDVSRDGVALTDLGRRIVDPDTAAEAAVEAFMQVDLYARIYDRYPSVRLPDARPLEAEFADLGVAPKQTAKARQAFMRSAEQANLFTLGRDRLSIPPNVDPSGDDTRQPEDVPHTPEYTPPATPEATSLDPAINGLLMHLPKPGTAWSKEHRDRWLAGFSAALDIVYPEEQRALPSPTEWGQPGN